ncbi:MAG: DUF4221 family protein [Bacteroides sp.]|uniref:DUF4221 family protein n=1 Tax=Bacteroides sp. TaxID=29523 RepID=UPI002FC8A16C
MHKISCVFFFTLASLSLLVSCGSVERDSYVLQPGNDSLVFSLNPQTSVFIKALFPYTDEKGNEFLTFQNNVEPQILVYDMNTQQYVKTIALEKEGADGVGVFCGYYIQSWDEIYIPCMMRNEIDVVDSKGKIRRRIQYSKTVEGKQTLPVLALSFPYTPLSIINKKMYLSQQSPNLRLGSRTVEDSPVTLVLDTISGELNEFSLRFPPIMTSERIQGNTLGSEFDYSQVLNDTNFVYSFFFDEKIKVVSLSGDVLRTVSAKSRYMDQPDLSNQNVDLASLPKILCQIPFYGNLIYDKYRDVYYRFVYPETEVQPNDNAMDIWQLGRSKFSIMILNKEFEVVGETLFPENTYASNHFFIREDGLYLSTSFVKNPNFSDDKLCFRRIELVKQPTN